MTGYGSFTVRLASFLASFVATIWSGINQNYGGFILKHTDVVYDCFLFDGGVPKIRSFRYNTTSTTLVLGVWSKD